MTDDTGDAETDTERPDDDRDPVILSNGAPGNRYVCDRCGTPVGLREAKITGELDDPDEVVCGDCITPEDRIITDGRGNR
jgi:DNA-directed RNA polymerase subunit RPC12/RpoP